MSEFRARMLGDDMAEPPVVVVDGDQTGEWHRRVVECLFHFGFDAVGLVHMSQVSHWAEDMCQVCSTGRRRGEPCWYCELEGAA